MKNKTLLSLSTIILFSSLYICYMYIAFYNRYASDDYYFFAKVKEIGVLEAAKYFNFNWEGAIFGFSYNFLISNVMWHFETPFLYNIFISVSTFAFFYLIYFIAFKEKGI